MKVSIIMPNKNKERWIGKSIQSVLNQTYENWELIIVDDGSTDRSFDIAKQFAREDSRIECVYDRNVSFPETRNLGFEVSSGKYVVFLDSDDFLDRNFLYNGVKNIKGYDAYSSSILIMTRKRNRKIMFRKGEYDSVDTIKQKIRLRNGNSLLKRKIIEKNNIRFPSYHVAEDDYFYILYSVFSKKIYVDDKIGQYINRLDSSLVRNSDPETVNTVLEVYNNLINELHKYGKDEFIEYVINYQLPVSLVTYLSNLPFPKRQIISLRYVKKLMKPHLIREYYLRDWFIVSLLDCFVPIRFLI